MVCWGQYRAMNMPEADIIEIFVNKETRELYLVIPASSMVFLLEMGEEQDIDVYDKERFKEIAQVNLDDIAD